MFVGRQRHVCMLGLLTQENSWSESFIFVSFPVSGSHGFHLTTFSFCTQSQGTTTIKYHTLHHHLCHYPCVVIMNSTGKSILVLTIVVTSTHALLSLFGQKRRMENVVRKYFDGVNKKDPEQIRSCFGDQAVIRDIVVSNTKRTVPAQVLVDRCMDFLTAHPDCQVNFHYGYVCLYCWDRVCYVLMPPRTCCSY